MRRSTADAYGIYPLCPVCIKSSPGGHRETSRGIHGICLRTDLPRVSVEVLAEEGPSQETLFVVRPTGRVEKADARESSWLKRK